VVQRTVEIDEYCRHEYCSTVGPLACVFLPDQLALFADWDTADISDDFLDTMSRYLLASLLKHCGLVSTLMHSHLYDVAHFYR